MLSAHFVRKEPVMVSPTFSIREEGIGRQYMLVQSMRLVGCFSLVYSCTVCCGNHLSKIASASIYTFSFWMALWRFM